MTAAPSIGFRLAWRVGAGLVALTIVGGLWLRPKTAKRIPEDPNRQFKQAMAVLQTGHLEEAEQRFRELLRSQPDSEPVQTELQWLLFNQMREREVETLLEEALSRSPAELRLLYHLLSTQQRRPIAQEAIGMLERANELVPGQSSVQLALARCAWQMGDTARARNLLETVHKNGNQNLESALVFAEFLIEQDDLQGAENALEPPDESVGQVWRNDDRWWWLQSRLAALHRRWDQSLTCLEEAVRRRPGEVRYANAEGVTRQALNQTEAAEAARARSVALADAERELYIIVSRGDLEQLTPAICREISKHCAILHRTAQAKGWLTLAGRQ